MPSFWKNLCCCFSYENGKKDYEISGKSSSYYKTNGQNESENNIYGNSLSQSYGGTTVHSVTSINGTMTNGLLSGFYKPKAKTPRDLVKALKFQLGRYNSNDQNKSLTKISGEISKPVSALKAQTLQSEEDVLRGDYDLQMFLIKEIYESDLLEILVEEIEKFPFEARKDAVIIFNSLLRRQIPPNRQIVAENLRDLRRNLLKTLLEGYDKPERTLHYGLMLRECIKFEFLAEIVLNLPEFERLFDYIQLPTFDVSSDAFATFKDLLTRHKNLITEFLIENYEMIFKRLNGLLSSENYVTRRQSLKLLGEILHDRRNYDVMLKYVSEVENLKLLMCQLRDKSEKIQFEAFQVFKIFIANPNKPKSIYDILCKNRDKILHFLENFSVQGKQMEDRNFNEDKIFLIEKLQLLPQYTKTIKSDQQVSESEANLAENIKSEDGTINEDQKNLQKVAINTDNSDQNETESLVLSRSASVLSESITSTEDDS